ncbi:SDR family oxidoreductase [Trichocoleus sp. FACHB-90]|uniref:SDR family oxidoreductase n=1 Tax=Cyanophyceae TaxID=3028117 RepID=UPI0016873334|nr:SDR family oxidoreductase [Trichocoleus sp. FACHB-90]MBD1928034.1 SDR family oxidoreductase [Trichocoleus sp. FACHB-90]
MKKIAIVTGANRGLGFETCRQLASKDIQVVLTSRDEAKGKAAVEKLQAEGLDVVYHPLDVTNAESIEHLAQFIRNEFGKLDILVNNAGIARDFTDAENSIFNTKIDTLQETIETNLYGPLLLSQALIPLMKKHNYGRVVNVSSGAGQLFEMNTGYPAYRISKTALNSLTRLFANELKDTNILVNAVCPGWVKTDMGGSNAPRTVEQGVDTIVWLATLPDDGATSGFWRDRQPIPW